MDEIMALEPARLKFAKRKIRVQRCKSTAAIEMAKKKKAALTQKEGTSRPANDGKTKATPLEKPKAGDPELGKRLIGLSKDERKAVKAADADRVARRLAKKKARNQLQQKGVEEDRQPKRKRSTGSAVVKKLHQRPKTRIRSEKSNLRKNVKK